MQQDNNPLVSIIVITYNSSKFVLETLESAKAQTYQNIELIVSDDCSTDNTLDICRKWLDENASRFVRTELVTTEKNSGIAPNCNRGVRVANGEWVRLIAGDDLLTIDAIEQYLSYYFNNKDACVIFSTAEKLYEDCNKRKICYIDKTYFNLSLTKQLKKQYCGFVITAPTAFISKKVLLATGGFDEQFPFIEDYPFYIKVLEKGFKMHLIDKPLFIYRIHSNNISTKKSNDNLYNARFVNDFWNIFVRIQRNALIRNFLFFRCFALFRENYIRKFIVEHGNNKDAITWYIKLFGYISPHPYIYFLRKHKIIK
jgi:glycosyltransferase involved in cell wall biosynthesis